MWRHAERRGHLRWNAAQTRYEAFDLTLFSQGIAISTFLLLSPPHIWVESP